MVQVRLLGPVTLGPGAAATLGGAKQRGVLAMLTGRVPPSCTDDQLIEALWGDERPPSARNAVQVHVTALRRILAPFGVSIVRAGQGYALAGTPLDVDAVRFETTVAQGRAALRGGDPGRAAQLLASALASWSGPPLDGVGEMPVFERWREALTSVRRSALADLAAARLRLGEHEEAMTTAQVLVRDHPFDEAGWVALATAEYWSGRAADALATCARARDLLAEELGVDPGPELAGLPTSILRHEMPDPTPEYPAEPAAPRLPDLPPAPQPFLGQEALVTEVTQHVAAGDRLTTLVGMGGIGKTSTALEVAHRLQDDGRRVLFCELESETDGISALERVCRDLGVEQDPDPAGAVAGGPADVVVLDNAEQVDGLAAVLEALVRRHARPAFVVTSRVPLQLRVERVVPVPPLRVDPDERESPATALFWATAARVRPGLDPVAEGDAVRELCDLLGGIPLAIELTARRMRTQTPRRLLDRVRGEHASLLDVAATVSGPARQASLGTVLGSAVENLAGPARTLLSLAAAVDGWVHQDTLERMSLRAGLDDAADALAEVVARGLAAVDDEDRVRLAQPVRTYVRSGLERTTASAGLLTMVVELAEELGPQLYDARTEEALARLVADADTISTALARATEPGADHAAAGSAARVLIGLRRYWLLAGRVPEARRAIAALDARGAPGGVESARLGILDGTLGQWVDDPGSGVRLTEALHRSAELDAPADRLLVSGWCSLAAEAAGRGDDEAAWPAVARAEASAELSGDPALLDLIDDLVGFVSSQSGDVERALEAHLRALGKARATGTSFVLVSLLAGTAENLSELGRDEEALELSDEAFARCAALPASPETIVAALIHGAVQVVSGRLAAGRGTCLEALRGARQVYPAPGVLTDGLRILAASAAATRRDHEAARLFGAAAAMRADGGLPEEDLTGTRIGRLIAEARERLGADAWRVGTTAGGADPPGLLDRVLAETE